MTALTFALFHGWWLFHALGGPHWKVFIDYDREPVQNRRGHTCEFIVPGPSKCGRIGHARPSVQVLDGDRLEVLFWDQECWRFVIDHSSRHRLRGRVGPCHGGSADGAFIARRK